MILFLTNISQSQDDLITDLVLQWRQLIPALSVSVDMAITIYHTPGRFPVVHDQRYEHTSITSQLKIHARLIIWLLHLDQAPGTLWQPVD